MQPEITRDGTAAHAAHNARTGRLPLVVDVRSATIIMRPCDLIELCEQMLQGVYRAGDLYRRGNEVNLPTIVTFQHDDTVRNSLRLS